jgi:hypothetical protein
MLTAGIRDMPESLVKFPVGCGASWLHHYYLLTAMVELPNYDISQSKIFGKARYLGTDEAW